MDMKDSKCTIFTIARDKICRRKGEDGLAIKQQTILMRPFLQNKAEKFLLHQIIYGSNR